jgi:hypothetical protein
MHLVELSRDDRQSFAYGKTDGNSAGSRLANPDRTKGRGCPGS